MKQVIFTLKLILYLVLAINLHGQTPDLINYQAIARDANGVLLSNQSLNIGFVVRSGSASGTIVYSEDHFGLMTNQFGLFNTQIGSGTPVIGTLSAIDWSSNSYYIEVRVNGAIIGVQQLVTVPYSFLSKNVENDSVNDADADPVNELQTISKIGNTIFLSHGGGSITDSIQDADADSVNELQTISKNGNMITLSGGGGSIKDSVQDDDADPVNEIQNLNLVGSELSISGGNKVILSINDTVWYRNGNDIYFNAGNVGIGTNTPNAKLVVSEDIRINGVTIGEGNGSILSNNAIGTGVLMSNTTGKNNTGAGYFALAFNTTGYENTAFGYSALSDNNSGYSNTATGYQSLLNNTNGLRNTANGAKSLFYNTGGNYNTASGYYSLYKNTMGRNNCAIGYFAIYSNTTGNYRTGLGYSANSVGISYDNSTGIGYNADPTSSNRIHVGNTSVTSIRGQVSFTTYSDERFKKNVRKDEVKGLEFITKLTPLTYNYDIDSYAKWIEDNYGEIDSSNWDSKYDIESFRFSGFMAQDVEQIANEIGYNFSGVDKPANDKDFYGLRYAEFVVPLVKAVQEQQEIIEDLQRQIDELKTVINQK
jgi:trimeric autotransporter adhesin